MSNLNQLLLDKRTNDFYRQTTELKKRKLMKAILQIVLLLLIPKNTFAEVNRTIPPGFDANAIELTYSTYIDGDLSVGGTISPIIGGSIGNAKTRTYSFPAQAMINRNATNIDSKFDDLYATNSRPLGSWSMVDSGSTQRHIGVAFGIPVEFDTSISPTVDIFIAVQVFGSVSRVANFAIDVDYLTSGNQIGVSSPATGLKQTVTTGNLSIVEPTGANNLRIYKLSVTLNPALITPGCFCNLYSYRVAPTSGTEYTNNLYLVAVNFNFSVT